MNIHCPNCNYEGKPKRKRAGSLLLEILLYLCFVFPGLIYSLVRFFRIKTLCPECGCENVVKLKSKKESSKKGNSRLQKLLKFAGILILISIVISLIAPADESTTIRSSLTTKNENTVLSKKSTAYKIASFAYKPGFEPQESTIQAVQFGLDELRSKCLNTEEKIGDYIYFAYDKLLKIDPTISILSIIDGINSSIPEASRDIDCAEISALYVVLQSEGQKDGLKPKEEQPKTVINEESVKTEKTEIVSTQNEAKAEMPQEEILQIPIETIGQKNAVRSAKNYLEYSSFSYEGLVKQLEYEQFSKTDAVYGADNSGADWNEQAIKSAKAYIEYSAFSRGSLIEQLKYDGFSQSQAEYGANAVGL